MANNYYDMTGVLVLDKVTPIIKALFDDFALDHHGEGEAYFACMAETNNPNWEDITERLYEILEGYGVIALPDDADQTTENILYSLASHFGANDDVSFNNLIEHADFSECVDLDVLFDIAQRLDDGHGLKAIKAEGCWHCDKPRLFEFGGNGEFYGRHFFTQATSSSALNLGSAVNDAIEAGDLDKAAEQFYKVATGLLAGITDADVRDDIRTRLSSALSTTSVSK